jgi:hypothetical protein
VEDEKTPTTSEAEDVEGHLLTGSERPDAEVSSEAPDVELHALTERPPNE